MRRLTERQKKLVDDNIGLAWQFVGMMAKRGYDADKVRCDAYYGLVRAAMTYKRKLSRGYFSGHAFRRMFAEFRARMHDDRMILVPIGHVRTDGNGRGLSCRAAAHRALAMKRKDGLEFVIADDSPDPQDVAIRDEEAQILRDAIDDLPDGQRAVVSGVLDGKRTVPMAEEFGVSRQAITERRKTAFAILRRRLARKGVA